jgi:O-antigen/teichoic acid export membrane protein
MEPSAHRRTWSLTQLLRRASSRDLPVGRRSLTHGASFAVVSFAVSALLALVSSILTARLYGIRIIGELALALAPSGILALLSTVREQPALVRRIAPLKPRQEAVTGLWLAVFTFSVTLTIAMALPVAIATWIVFHGPIGQPQLFGPAMAYLGGYVLVLNTSANFDSIFAAFGDGRQLFIVRLHEALVVLVLVAALSFHPSVWSPIVAALVGWTTALAHRAVSARRWFSFHASRSAVRAGFNELGAIVRFGLKMTPGSLATGTATQAGIWTLGIVAPVTVVGSYSRAWGISARFVEVNWRLAEIVFPALVAHHANGDRAAFERVYVTALRYATTLLVGLAAVAGGAATAIMAFFGPGFASASTALAITLLVPCTTTFATLQASGLLALGLPGATSKVAILSSAVVLVGTAVLTGPLGATGPALALVIGSIVGIVLGYVVTRRHVRPPFRELWPYRQRLLTVLAYGLAFLAARLVSSVVTGAVGVLPALAVGTAIYCLVFVAGGGVMPEDRERLARVLRKLRGRSDTPPTSPGELAV